MAREVGPEGLVELQRSAKLPLRVLVVPEVFVGGSREVMIVGQVEAILARRGEVPRELLAARGESADHGVRFVGRAQLPEGRRQVAQVVAQELPALDVARL